MLVYTARHLLPVGSPPVVDGAVAVADGRVVAVGRRKDVVKSVKAAEVRDLGEAIVMPGLVNAHTHLELSWMHEVGLPDGDYVGWIRAVVARRGDADEARIRAAAKAAIEGMTSRGTVAVGDVQNTTLVPALLAASTLRGVMFHELLGWRAADAERILERAAVALDAIESDRAVKEARGRLLLALTPHAAHSTSAPLLKALGGRAAATSEPIAIHVAESEDEVRLLRDGTGPFADFLRERGVWDDAWKAPGLTPVDHLDRLGLLTPRTLAVHGVHLTHTDMARLQARGTTVVTCPRSNRTLGVGVAPVPKLLGSGIPVAIGTDSLASSPDLDLFAEIQALREEHPTLAPAAALRMATLNGARALGISADLGTIEKGRLASLVVVPLEDPAWDPIEVVTWNPAAAFALDAAPWEARAA
ncbi:MAG TPA: amidohydrolase family protein [Candidatus Polarisedimenticolaceae bacterium]